MNRRGRMAIAAAAAALVTAGLISPVTPLTAQAAAGCQVGYQVSSQWPGGFGVNVTVTNLGDAINGWALAWTFPSGQTITQLWNGTYTQSGSQVTVRDASWNAAIPAGGSTSFGFNGAWGSANVAPTSFTLNGTACNGPVTTSSTSSTTSSTSSTTTTTTTSPTTTTTTTSPVTTTTTTSP